jgi:hypothetical protein
MVAAPETVRCSCELQFTTVVKCNLQLLRQQSLRTFDQFDPVLPDFLVEHAKAGKYTM